MSIAEDTVLARQCAEMRSDNIALRNALARTMAERDHWREQCEKDKARAADCLRRLRLTIEEFGV